MDIDFEGLYRFHGHKCPMSTMGARLGAAAMAALGVTKADQFKVRGVYRSRNCALDGVQFVTGCTMGNGNLECDDRSVASFTLIWRDRRGGATATISDAALERFRKHKEMKAELEPEIAAAEPARRSELEGELKAAFDALVDWVQTEPEGSLLSVTRS